VTGAGNITALTSRPAGGQFQNNNFNVVTIQQGAYLDAYGNPILQPNTQYKARAWIQITGGPISGGWVEVILWSTGTGLIANGFFPVTTQATFTGWVEVTFSAKTPLTIPANLQLQVSLYNGGGAGQIWIDELSIILS